MDSRPPQQAEASNKKPKLEVPKDTTDDHTSSAGVVVELITDGASSSAPSSSSNETSAVTALAVLDDDTLFSGHRNGLIQRWDLGGASSSSTEPPPPRWSIPSCADLTRHETYGQCEALGVAGLAVRQQGDSEEQLLVYSWNHQREDMRATVNGIPNKIMIWRGATGERVAALMIDVGRCQLTGKFANPLPSCVIFCPLLVNKEEKPPVGGGASAATSGTTITTRVWTDTVLVGLQATCEEESRKPQPPTTSAQGNKEEEPSEEKKPAPPPPPLAAPPPKIGGIGGQTLPPAIAAKLGVGLGRGGGQTLPPAVAAKLAGMSTTPKQQQARPQPPTGNVVPFDETTRKRMKPWAATGGFVRALASVPRKYVIGVTERTATTHTGTSSASAGDPPAANGATAEKEKEGGEASAIFLWDAANPGIVLHKLDLFGAGTQSLTSTTMLRGTVFGCWLSNKNDLVLAVNGSSSSSRESGKTTWLTTVEILEDSNTNGDDKECSRAPPQLTIQGPTNTATPSVAAAACGDDTVALAVAAAASGSSSSTDIVLYGRSYNNKGEFTERGREVLSSNAACATSGLAALSVYGSWLIAGFQNGTILRQATALISSTTKTANLTSERSCCSTAPLGLHGMLCPHLTSEANSVQLQNQCVIQ